MGKHRTYLRKRQRGHCGRNRVSKRKTMSHELSEEIGSSRGSIGKNSGFYSEQNEKSLEDSEAYVCLYVCIITCLIQMAKLCNIYPFAIILLAYCSSDPKCFLLYNCIFILIGMLNDGV